MAYRYTDTDKWADGWFLDLPDTEKLLFCYLIDRCDIAGFYEISWRKLTANFTVDEEAIKKALQGLRRGLVWSNDKTVIWLKNFLKHQKNLPLNIANNAHLGILKRFEKYSQRFDFNLIEPIVNYKFDNTYLRGLKGASEGLLSPTGNDNGIGIGNEGIKEGGLGETKITPYQNFINEFNKIRGTRFTIKDKKAKRYYENRIKEGYTDQEIFIALKNLMNDPFHIENNYTYLTPEFMTRSCKIEKGLNILTTKNHNIKLESKTERILKTGLEAREEFRQEVSYDSNTNGD